jgi:hypothetical protein
MLEPKTKFYFMFIPLPQHQYVTIQRISLYANIFGNNKFVCTNNTLSATKSTHVV